MRRFGPLPVVLLISLVAACGGGEESESPPVTVEDYASTVPPEGRSLADWQEGMGAVCVEYDPRLVAAGQALDATPESLEELVARIDAFNEVLIAAFGEMRAVPVPTERTREVNELHDRLDRAEDSFLALRESAARGDYTSAQASLGTLTNYADFSELLEELEVDGCL